MENAGTDRLLLEIAPELISLRAHHQCGAGCVFMSLLWHLFGSSTYLIRAVRTVCSCYCSGICCVKLAFRQQFPRAFFAILLNRLSGRFRGGGSTNADTKACNNHQSPIPREGRPSTRIKRGRTRISRMTLETRRPQVMRRLYSHISECS